MATIVNKAAAIHNFWGNFEIPQYEENTVPSDEDKPSFPYITYTLTTDSIGNEIALNASIWYRSESWKPINNKTQEISDYIGRSGKLIECDGGAIWLRRGTPFAQNMGDENDDKIKRKYLNVIAEYFTAN